MDSSPPDPRKLSEAALLALLQEGLEHAQRASHHARLAEQLLEDALQRLSSEAPQAETLEDAHPPSAPSSADSGWSEDLSAVSEATRRRITSARERLRVAQARIRALEERRDTAESSAAKPHPPAQARPASPHRERMSRPRPEPKARPRRESKARPRRESKARPPRENKTPPRRVDTGRSVGGRGRAEPPAPTATLPAPSLDPSSRPGSLAALQQARRNSMLARRDPSERPAAAIERSAPFSSAVSSPTPPAAEAYPDPRPISKAVLKERRRQASQQRQGGERPAMQAFLEPEPPVQDKPVLWMQALEGAQWGSEPLACIEDLGRLLTHGGPIPRRVLARIWGELVEHHRQHQRRIPVEISQIFQEINRSRGCA